MGMGEYWPLIAPKMSIEQFSKATIECSCNPRFVSGGVVRYCVHQWLGVDLTTRGMSYSG